MTYLLISRILLAFCSLQSLPLSYQTQEAGPKVTRTVERVAGTNEYQVTISIKAPGLHHMFEYVDYLPADSKVIFKEKADYDVKREGNTIKYIWIAFPGTEEEKVSYRITFAGIPGFFYRGQLKYVIGKDAKVLELGENDIKVIH
jgi:hypothetical protein